MRSPGRGPESGCHAMGRLAVLALAGLAVACSATPAAAPPTALDRFVAVLSATRNVRASFSQVRHSSLLPEPLPAAGRLWLSRPGQLKLVYLEPEPMTLLKRADTTWIYLPSLGQVQRYRVEAVGVPLGLALGSSRQALEQSVRREADGDWVRLEPRADRPAAWSRIDLELPPGGTFPKRLIVHQEGGERLEFTFREVRRNQGLPAATFAPDWPDTVPVVRVGR